VTHPALVNLPPSKQREEIVNCKVFLENVLDDSIKSFSYPFGLKSDYSNETINIVREAGFSCACSNEIDTVWSKSDLYQLPRYWVKNWPGSVFEKHLQMWLPG
jgi:peptidoglycan/xylan/chitin deacetylase (PgdA/CDA1 family)